MEFFSLSDSGPDTKGSLVTKDFVPHLYSGSSLSHFRGPSALILCHRAIFVAGSLMGHPSRTWDTAAEEQISP